MSDNYMKKAEGTEKLQEKYACMIAQKALAEACEERGINDD